MRGARRPFSQRIRVLALQAAALNGVAAANAAAPNAAAANAADAPRLSVSQPAGFDSLLQPQEALADIVVAGRTVGQVQVRYASGKVTLLDVDAVVNALPDVIDRAAVRAALAAPDLDTHAGLVCRNDIDADRSACGVLRPDVAGVIFDEQRFRLDVFVAARLLAVHAAIPRAYLQRPAAAPSLVDQLGGSLSGTGGRASYTLQNRAILAFGEARVRNEASYSSSYGLSVDALVAELDKPGLRYSAGAMWVPGIDLVGRRRLVGVGVQSQIDTRLDRSVLAGTPLIVSLSRRARVEILRDGRLLTSHNYEAGNQTLDTASLPDGAYEVVLRIQEAGGPPRDERRFFTRNAAIAGIGEPIFFGYVGMLGADRRGSPLATTRTPLYEGGIARRLTGHVALDATVLGTDKTALFELGGYWLSRAVQLRLAGLTSIHGDAGLFVQANSSGTSRFNYNVDARRVWSRRDAPLIPFGGDAGLGYAGIGVDRTAQLAAGSFTQANATISYTPRRAQLGVTAAFRRDPRQGRSYAIGPSVYMPVAERAGVQINLRGDMTISNHGTTAFLGLSFQRLRARSSLSGGIGGRTTTGAGDGNRTALVGAIGGSWQRDHVLGGDASLAAGAEREVNGTLVRGRVDLNTAYAAINGDVAQPVAGDNGSTQYSFNFQTTAAVTPRSVTFQGREQQDSVILVGVDGVANGTPFEVLVDNAPRGTVRAGTTLSVPVTAYRQYAVRLRALAADIVKFDGGAKMVGVYPGNVGRVRWAARRVVAMFGRIVGPDGGPIAEAGVSVPGAIGSTDANGYFQIEAGAGDVLTVQSADGSQCALPLRVPATPQGYAALGTLVCVQALPKMQMASAKR